MADSVFELNAIQLAKQSAFNSIQTTATYIWGGRGSLKFEDSVIQPNYVTGEPGGLTAEDVFIADTGSMINLADVPVSPTMMTWIGCMAVKDLSASNTTYLFTTPTSTAFAAQTIIPFTFKLVTGHQAYDVQDCFIEEFNFHGDVASNNGQVQVNAKVGGRTAVTGTKTASLGLLPNHTASILNQNSCGFKLSTIGTIPAATAQTGLVQAISLNWKTGFTRGRYSDSRTAKDYAVIDGGGLHHDITGTIRLMFGAGTAGTSGAAQIAIARAGTSKSALLTYTAGNGDTCAFAFPMVFTDVPELGNSEQDGMVTVEFPFRVGYARSTTVESPNFTTVIAVGTVVT